MQVIETINGIPMLTLDRCEYWRIELADAVCASAKHGASEHIDNAIQALVLEVSLAIESENN